MPDPQEQEKKQLRVLGPDNRHYLMPQGTTKEQAISYFKRKGILSPESKPPVEQPKGATPPKAGITPPTGGPPTAPKHPVIQGLGEGFMEGSGFDTEKINKYGKLEIVRQTTQNFGKMIDDVLHDPNKVGDLVDGMRTTINQGFGELSEGTRSGDSQRMAHGTGKVFAGVMQLLGGEEGLKSVVKHAGMTDGAVRAAGEIAQKTGMNVDEATRVAHRATNKTPSRFLKMKAFNDSYIHAKGLDIGKKIGKAADAVHEEVKLHADGIAEKIDTKIPSGVIDASDVAKNIIDNFKEEVKAPEKAHPQLTVMIKDATATAPGMWNWEKARQLRSSVGRVMDKVQGPQKVVLAKAYKDLTTKLGSTAKQYGLEKEWNHYNELSRKYEQQYADTVDDVRSAQHGHGVAQKLNSHKALSHEMVHDLSKYGLNEEEVRNFIRDSERMTKQSQGMKGTLFRMAYGTPVGVPVMIMGRMTGAGWLGSVAMGAGAGYLSSYLINLARVSKLSPDVIEAIAKSRELPGKMKLGEGNFPTEGGPPQLPAPKKDEPKPPAPPQLPGAKGGISSAGSEQAMKSSTPEQSAQALRVETDELETRLRSGKGTAKERVDLKVRIKENKGLIEEFDKKAKPQAKDRWYQDPGHIPGEPHSYLDVVEKGGEISEARAVVIEVEQSGGRPSKWQAQAFGGRPIGTFDHMEEAQKAAEKDIDEKLAVKKAAPGEVGREPGVKPGTTKESAIGRRTKARERVEKAREKAKRAQNTEQDEARARSQAKGMDASQLQIPEMEEYLKAKRPNELRSLQTLRKKGIPDAEYIEGLKYLILEGLEESEPN